MSATPTRIIPVTNASARHIERDPERTAFALVNMDVAGIVYISDQHNPVTAANGFPIYPRTYMTFDRRSGWEPQKAYYLISSIAANNVGYIDAYGEVALEPMERGIEATPQRPRSPY